MNALEIGDVVRLRDDPSRGHGRVVMFAEEEMIRYALVEWPGGTRSAHPEEELERVKPP